MISDAIRKKQLCFFFKNMFFFFLTCFFRIKNLASEKNTQCFFFFFQNTHLKEISYKLTIA